MALQSCRECGRPVSTEAPSCPHCGAPRPTAAANNPPQDQQRPYTPAPAAPPSRARERAGTALGWIVAVFLALMGLGALVTDLLAGFLFFVAAAVVLPPVNAWLKAKLNVAIPWKVQAWLVLGLIMGAAVSMARGVSRGEERDAARAADVRADALRADFATNAPAIRQRMDSALKARNYALAVSIGQRYVNVVHDPQLAKLYTDAQAGQRREADRAKERNLLARVAATPTSNLEANRDLYRQLVALNPSNTSYKAKYDEYNNQIRQQQVAVQDRIRRFGPIPRRYSSGTYDEVEEYLRQVMNDPKTLEGVECTEVNHVERGWLVGCNYRGANAFGGIIRQANWFIIRQGRVIEMLPFSAYRP
jgi:hypothetical protein